MLQSIIKVTISPCWSFSVSYEIGVEFWTLTALVLEWFPAWCNLISISRDSLNVLTFDEAVGFLATSLMDVRRVASGDSTYLKKNINFIDWMVCASNLLEYSIAWDEDFQESQWSWISI